MASGSDIPDPNKPKNSGAKAATSAATATELHKTVGKKAPKLKDKPAPKLKKK